MTKITKQTVEQLLIPKGWKKRDFFEDYKSPDGRCELQYCSDSHLRDDTGFGWTILIDNSRHESLAFCYVEYIEQVETLIEMYKNY